ncbi:alkene reductase [Noviherbaspirillum aerium]|uniref:alkene reductase n=1 Tax=Noviherbaspirillum aerium TaxID=2588497 RepID=UPI00124DE194|nr:alkene reductase [Noviherbaspirillum aerium]
MKTILQQLDIGDLSLNNRVAMAPVTRSRSGDDGVPTATNAEYYKQRASAGLIISEATNISPMSAAFELAPGLYNDSQVNGWKLVSEAVHSVGGRIFAQLWHSGRVSSYALLEGKEPISPSGMNEDIHALQVYGAMRNGYYTRMAASPSRAMSVEEIYGVIHEFRVGARNALRAGLDGVEIHAANGYLPQQFLSPHVNRRTDQFGGSIENRARFLRLVLEAVMETFPACRIGVRISPFALYNNALDPDPVTTYCHVTRLLNEYGIGYVHGADTNAWGGAPDMDRIIQLIRTNYHGIFIANGGLSPEQAHALVDGGQADMVAFGRQYIANPDLVERIASNGPYNIPDAFTFYGGGARGYTDYPRLDAEYQRVA